MKKMYVAVYLLFFVFTVKGQVDSLDIKIGQMILFGFDGNTANNISIIKDVEKGYVGGVLLFGRNIGTPTKLAAMNARIKLANKIPVFISIDQEGGIVNRLPQKLGYPKMPSAKWLGDKNDIATTKTYANTLVSTIKNVGINLNFAPNVDVHKATCPVIGRLGRSFSIDPQNIYKHAAVVVTAHNSQKVIPVLKHFPGHGSSNTDSHLGLTDISKTWNKSELIPFDNLIKMGDASAIMCGHLINKKLDDSKLPATLSKKILTNLLRDSMRFDGVIFSDDMNMHAIAANYKMDKAIELAINAGVDVLVFSNNIGGSKVVSPIAIHNIIKKLIANGSISLRRIDESYKRIMYLKNTLL